MDWVLRKFGIGKYGIGKVEVDNDRPQSTGNEAVFTASTWLRDMHFWLHGIIGIFNLREI